MSNKKTSQKVEEAEVSKQTDIIEDGSHNETILKKITEHQDAIRDLKKQLKPTPSLKVASLAQSNSAALKQRQEKFEKKKAEKKKVDMLLALDAKQKKNA